MNRIAVAQELVGLARELMGVDFATEHQKQEYHKLHPKTDPGTMHVRHDQVNKERQLREKQG